MALLCPVTDLTLGTRMTLSTCINAFGAIRNELLYLDSSELKRLEDVCSSVLLAIRGARRVRSYLDLGGGWNRLLPETRRYILELCAAGEDPRTHSNIPTTLSLVSSGWRHDVERTPVLWSNVVLHAPTWTEFCLVMRRGTLWIRRSFQVPLRLYITFPLDDFNITNQAARMAAGLARNHLFHCEVLVLSIYGGITVNEMFSFLQHPAPLLTTLSITYPNYTGDDEGNEAAAQLLVNNLLALQSPRLTRVTLPTFSLDWCIPAFNNVTILCIISHSAFSTSLAKLVAVFRLQKLVEVKLGGFLVSLDDDIAQPVLNRSVQKITLHGRNFGDSMGLLDRLDLPRLEELMIAGFSTLR